ncbi:hypothetical protein [Prescottella equi]|uniref:hypothetical protein n=1 Tax=Rhodococcus hoagii TaxID=43767 RepID=UPI0007CD4FCE|nr:hypothetical protein [Prescottella equi]ORL01570.1 hypothetical protein A6F56_04420 [Prescottella equi]
MVDIGIIGANKDRIDVSGRLAGRQGIILAAGQVQGIHDAPVKTEWTSGRLEVGGRSKGASYEVRDLLLGFHLFGEDSDGGVTELSSRLRKMFTYERDPWDPDEQLAAMFCKTRRSLRKLHFQLYDPIANDPEFDPEIDEYENVIFPLRAGQPMWESRKDVTVWKTTQSSDSGFIEVWNPTDRPLLQTWVLTRGQWTISDTSWIGPKGKRVPGGEFGGRTLPLNPIDAVHGGARINLDPMKLMVESWSGTNLLGELAGQFFFMHEIPPYTPPTLLPIAVTGAPSGGARAELHMRRFWSRPWGLEWR